VFNEFLKHNVFIALLILNVYLFLFDNAPFDFKKVAAKPIYFVDKFFLRGYFKRIFK